MIFSKFGKRLTCDAGILSLMDDLGDSQCSGDQEMIMMGGGNPGHVPEFQALLRRHLAAICDDAKAFQSLVGAYSPPQGDMAFIASLARLLKKEYGWQVEPENICLTNGSQTAFFMLFNLFAGQFPDGSCKKICLPLAPEYIGYADLGLCDDFFETTRPKIEYIDDIFFKYHIDFEALKVGEDIGAICVSRPTNPTGNVITDLEVSTLAELAKARGIPLIIDSAYGLPFPGMVFTEANPHWDENTVVCLSLSKLGLPAVRTGIIIARKEVVRALASMNAIMSLSPGSFGAVLTQRLIESSEIIELSRNLMTPFYRNKMEKAVACVQRECAGTPYRIHKPEGAMFLWLWFVGLPISSLELYRRLKNEGALVVSGHYFFPGLKGEWQHKNECIRVTYSQNDQDVARGIAIIGREVRKAYEEMGR
ncbi:MAG: valine--pyruvate transaminase [Desulfoprunum sp.]|nr:valine--pyruvate transaminase [Desulfoprunum sp.]